MIDWKRLFRKWRKAAEVTERRLSARRRTKLRPGKIVTLDHAFLADCAILDRSETGLRLRPFGTVEPEDGMVAVFDEENGMVASGHIAWRRRGEIGLRLDGPAGRADDETIRRLNDRYYAIGD